MERLRYVDFELKVEKSDAVYIARVLHSPTGEATTTFVLPLSEDRLENLILKIARSRAITRGIHSPELVAARELGGNLFDAVFANDVRACLRSSIDEAFRHEDVGLRIKLHLQDVAELADLPWEFLFDTSLNRFFAQSNLTPIVRYIEMPQRVQPLVTMLPLRILVMISNPTDVAYLDVDRERTLLQKALDLNIRNGRVQVDWLDKATLPSLQRRLRDSKYHIFHYIGHGGFDQKTGEGVLILQNEQGHSWIADADRIGTILHDHRTLRLAVLNSCEGARNSRVDPFSGVAANLIKQGLPAVVAMQFEITDDAAIAFSSELYAVVAEGFPIDAAVAEARKAVYARPNDIEWGTPVLYMRASDGRIFDLDQVEGEPSARDRGESSTSSLNDPISPSSKSERQKDIPLEDSNTREKLVQEGIVRTPQIETATAIGQVKQSLITEHLPIQFDWVKVDAGEFLMGSDRTADPTACNEELPQHSLCLRTFYISRVPVTNSQYKLFIDATNHPHPSHWIVREGKASIPKGKENHPVVNVTWKDAWQFCRWAGTRLPTEAEWEKAARGTDGRTYPWGNNKLDKLHCNFNGIIGDTTPVGSYPEGTSPYGALDMLGNVWEWTNSLWSNQLAFLPSLLTSNDSMNLNWRSQPPGYGFRQHSYIPSSDWIKLDVLHDLFDTRDMPYHYYGYPYSPDDGREVSIDVDGQPGRSEDPFSSLREEDGSRRHRVLRGGSFLEEGARVRCASRARLAPDIPQQHIGFRVVLMMQEELAKKDSDVVLNDLFRFLALFSVVVFLIGGVLGVLYTVFSSHGSLIWNIVIGGILALVAGFIGLLVIAWILDRY